MFLISSTCFAQVDYGIKSKMKFKITKSVNAVFSELGKSYVHNYNKRRFNYKKIVTKEFKNNGIKFSHLERKLPKALFKNNEIHIPEIGLVQSLNNFLEHSFLLKGKKIKVTCIARSECLKDLISKVKSQKYGKSKSILMNLIIPSAFAKTSFKKTNENFQIFLDKNDTKLIAALMSLKGTPNGATDFDMPKEHCNIFCSSTDNSLNSAMVLEKVKEHMSKLLDRCDDLSNQYKLTYRSHDYYNGSPINQLIKTMTGDKLLNDSDQKVFLDKYIKADQLTELNQEELAKLSCEKSYPMAHAEIDIDEIRESRLEVIQANLLKIDHMNHSNMAISDPKRMERQKRLIAEREKLKGGDTSSLYKDSAKDFCDILKEVKSCMQDYYSYKNQPRRVNNNDELKNLRNNINEKLKNRPSGSYRE